MKIFGLRGNQLGALEGLIDAWDLQGVHDYYQSQPLDDGVREQAVWKTAWALTTQPHPLPMDAWDLWEVVIDQCTKITDTNCLSTFLMSSHPYPYVTHDILARVQAGPHDLAKALNMSVISRDINNVQAFVEFFPQVPVADALRVSILHEQPDLCMMLAGHCNDLTGAIKFACLGGHKDLAKNMLDLNKHVETTINDAISELSDTPEDVLAKQIWHTLLAERQNSTLSQAVETHDLRTKMRSKL